ncbi:MAG: GNAT family N-acetyltransferase [Immundisolibacteraceae bacterium]|nr:GNAT family N-acetyltransferase [Immundisolibacteraceae bacterium]
MPEIEDQKLWAELYSSAVNPHYLQSPHWNQHTNATKIMSMDRDGRPTAGSMIQRIPVLGGAWAYYEVIRGPLFVTTAALRTHLREIHSRLPTDAIGIRASPYLIESDRCYEETRDILAREGYSVINSSLYTSTPITQLRTGIEDIRQNYRSGFRRQLRKARKHNIHIVNGSSPEDMNVYIAGHTAANRARGASPPNEEIVRGWSHLITQGPNHLRLNFAKYEGQIIAGHVCLPSGNRLLYEWGYSNPDRRFNNLPKSHILHDAAIEYAVKSGFSSYDLGGYWIEQGNSNSINRFKLSITENIEQVMPRHQLITKPRIHKTYLLLRKMAHGPSSLVSTSRQHRPS